MTKNLEKRYVKMVKRRNNRLLVVIAMVSIFMFFILLLGGCKARRADYTVSQAESALKAGKSIDNKTIDVTPETKVLPNTPFGYNIEAGHHLNFVSGENPHVKVGQTIRVKVTKVQSYFGSYLINYEKVN